ncbi:dipeptide/oligopeptide/nickel ABC transporter ATP-binding protein [uncultured Alsobacter sp.]|uniref:ATP-binding cassette domain-containing protein n=1 Tax=uncultured Alsobacter sp. TaxID=1748258 RepID=UPI0025D731C0|nr:dipeptide/oligopeptide/nickel ABC transporter ATP-binding protein [uncultured Alsobacter sp.]
MTAPAIEARGLRKTFRSGSRTVAALDDVSLTLAPGETLAVVGASGSGKTTLARALMRLFDLDGGSVSLRGRDLLALSGAALRAERRHLQMVFQDPAAALNPRATIGRVIEDPLRVHSIVPASRRRDAVSGLLARVGLPADLADRPVHALSGGQRQRVAIARAMATQPAVLVLDEPVSALDVSVRGQILNLLMDLQREDGIAYLFISHDMGVVRAVADRVAVMAAGRIVEAGHTATVFASPQAAETRALLDAVPHLPPRPADEVSR